MYQMLSEFNNNNILIFLLMSESVQKKKTTTLQTWNQEIYKNIKTYSVVFTKSCVQENVLKRKILCCGNFME